MKTLYLIVLIFGISSSYATTGAISQLDKQIFIEEHLPYVFEINKKYKIPVSIILAQFLIESGWGTSEGYLYHNACFNIKCKKDNPFGEFYKFDDDNDKNGNIVESCFRSYNSKVESFQNYGQFLSTRSYYNKLFDLDSNDYRSWAYGLSCYATKIDYSQCLINIIEENHLFNYDIVDKMEQLNYSQLMTKNCFHAKIAEELLNPPTYKIEELTEKSINKKTEHIDSEYIVTNWQENNNFQANYKNTTYKTDLEEEATSINFHKIKL